MARESREFVQHLGEDLAGGHTDCVGHFDLTLTGGDGGGSKK